ncbi:hypothetical protein LTR56_003212 [Elasticomyces elasticus]|nr:hypothetical protein LTR22_010745 [Elasticomyces elasticus]KAK3656080.1 hypothetical protein LTR56_003212 [Elasticomyces elasticus]KAK4920856.1 hypothetical protein LTR49_011578 [Elasticomyces elasticus]KAK5759626.1 hypothetical protein LTS12_010319 [Elasticomyces elasticus]
MAPLAHPSGARNAGIPFTMLTPASSTPKQPNTTQAQAPANSTPKQPNTTQAQPKATAATSQPQPKPTAAMSLFGNTNTQPTGTGLFGSAQPQQQPQQQQSLFANNNNNTQSSTGTGLFGSSLAQPQQQSNSLFSNLGNNNQQAAKPSLFGAPTDQPQQQQQPSLFSNLGSNSTQQQPAKPSLFSNLGGYNSTQQPAPTNSLFGSTNNAQNPQQISNWSGGSTMNQQQQQQPQGSSIFGLTSLPPDQLNHSLLAASQYRASQQQSQFAGKLSMGQQSTQQQQPAGAVKVHANDLRGTTRFADCIDDVKSQFEMVDTMIQKQERFCREIQAMLPKHEEDVLCLEPSVQVVKEMAENVEKVLIEDARAVDRAKQEVREKDAVDFKRCQRVVEGMMLPAAGGYGYGASSVGYYGGNASTGGKTGEEDYDTDLIGNYFIPLASTLQATLDKYAANLTDIENHMRVIESSAQVQAQQLAAKWAGVSGARVGSDETIQELAETLTGFEQSILGVAGVVGECREGVEGLVMGRVGQRFGGSRLGRRPW